MKLVNTYEQYKNTYITTFKYPTQKYLNVVKRGYKDCNLEKKYLTKALVPLHDKKSTMS